MKHTTLYYIYIYYVPNPSFKNGQSVSVLNITKFITRKKILKQKYSFDYFNNNYESYDGKEVKTHCRDKLVNVE
jgi:hypothetical protein